MSDVDTLEWTTDNINYAICHDVKDETAPFGEAIITRLYILSRLASARVGCAPIHASKERAGITVCLCQILFSLGVAPYRSELCSAL